MARAEALIECGLGETRALVVEHGRIAEIHIERDMDIAVDTALRPGAVWTARLVEILVSGRRGIVSLGGGAQALIEPLPQAATKGGLLAVSVTRMALPERGRPRLPKVQAADIAARADIVEMTPAPTLEDRLRARGLPCRHVSGHGPDLLEAAGWSEMIDAAQTGFLPFSTGLLTITPTPAMTLIDVDGPGDPIALMQAGAVAAARAIRLFDIGGSIGIDLPTVTGKEARQAAVSAFDAALPQPFERTVINGFGFLQVVRRRQRPSVIEMLQGDPVAAAALALLRRAGRTDGVGPCTLHAAPAVIDWLAARPRLVAALETGLGVAVCLHPRPELPIAGAYAARAPR